jgi:predicted ATPase
MKDVSSARHKQILITTHNPELIKYFDLESIFHISRKGCFSNVSKPNESQEVNEFLKNELGVDELFVKGLLK